MIFSKVCFGCNEEKDSSKYSLKRGKPMAQCKVCEAARNKLYRENNKEKTAARNAKYWEHYKTTEVWREGNRKKCKKYQLANLDWYRNYMALRRANQLHATPTWANLEKINEIYSKCPSGFHVDHIIPLKNPSVCGLHVEANLQYLTAQENMSKSNKFNIT